MVKRLKRAVEGIPLIGIGIAIAIIVTGEQCPSCLTCPALLNNPHPSLMPFYRCFTPARMKQSHPPSVHQSTPAADHGPLRAAPPRRALWCWGRGPSECSSCVPAAVPSWCLPWRVSRRCTDARGAAVAAGMPAQLQPRRSLRRMIGSATAAP